jgi:hypothetical protein
VTAPTPAHRRAALQLCRQARRWCVTVRTNSMGSAVPAGSRVEVESCGAAEVRPGEILLLERNGASHLHRLLCREGGAGGRLLCRGDARWRPDPWWPAEAVMGRAVRLDGGTESRPLQPGRGRRLQAAALGLLFRVLAVLPGVGPRLVRAGAQAQTPPAADPQAASAEVQHLSGRWRVVAEDPELLADLPERVGPAPGGDGADGLCTARVRVVSARPDTEPLCRAEDARLELITDDCRVEADLAAGTLEVCGADVVATREGLRTAFRALALKAAVARGGVALHAASAVDAEGRLYVFAGPSGCGKTTAAGTFGSGRQRDEDLVLLVPERAPQQGEVPVYRRAGADPQARGVERPAAEPVAAILLPEAGPGWEVEPLTGAAALRRVLHLPRVLSEAERASALSHALRLTAAVPVLRLRWSLGEDLPARLQAWRPGSSGD